MSACTSVTHSSFMTTRTPSIGVLVRSLISSMIAFMALGLMFSLVALAACIVAEASRCAGGSFAVRQESGLRLDFTRTTDACALRVTHPAAVSERYER